MFEPLRQAVFLDPSSLRQLLLNQGGGLSMSSAFMLLLGNTRRGETYVKVASIQVTIVTNEPLYAEDRKIFRLPLTHWHTTFYNTWRTYIYIYIWSAYS